jgi:UDP-glucose:tetrahydrobiopterin glucosyltransferase
MKIAVIAHLYYPIRLPYDGGLEAHTHQLVQALVAAGHQVTLFAKAGSQTAGQDVIIAPRTTIGGKAFIDNQAYNYTMSRIKRGNFDLIFNNSLHAVPLQKHTTAMPPMITIFHTPPLPPMVTVLERQESRLNRAYIAVSDFTANQWQPHCSDIINVVRNGIDLSDWQARQQAPTTASASWVGRITAEKGTHMAMQACIAMDLPITVAGVIYDKKYFTAYVAPLLKHPLVTYVGHADRATVNEIYMRSSVALITPMWDEPFGLVAVEALASGTPVAAYARGGLASTVTPAVGALAKQNTTTALQAAITEALTKDRIECILHARHNFTLEKMVTSYLQHVPAMQPQLEESDLVWVAAQ